MKYNKIDPDHMPGFYGKKILLGIAIVLMALGIIFYTFRSLTMPRNLERYREGTYSPMLIGEATNIAFDHYLFVYPNHYYFGTNLNAEEVMNAFGKQSQINEIIDLGQGSDGAGRYLFKIGKKAPYAYQELYVMPESFYKKAKHSYLLYDGSLNIRDKENSYEILFPNVILDYDCRKIIENGGAISKEDNRWELRDSNFTSGESWLDFLLTFYEESVLYHVISKEMNEFEVSFDASSIEKEELNPEKKRRMEQIYKGVFKVKVDEENKIVQILL